MFWEELRRISECKERRRVQCLRSHGLTYGGEETRMSGDGVSGKAWTGTEIDLAVATYLDIYERSAAGENYSKSDVYRGLSARLEVRTPKSIARKMSNISFVLVELGWPHLPGLRPLPNIQGAIVPKVVAAIKDRGGLDDAAQNLLLPAAMLGPVDLVFATFIPRIGRLEWPERVNTWVPVKRDYVGLEARNAALGLAGELAVLQFEEQRLREAGAANLARRIDHVSQSEGDGLGYDIKSFDADGREKYIEVKTTTGGNTMPFFLTRRELVVSTRLPNNYCLARVYDFPRAVGGRKAAGLYELRGALDSTCRLTPHTYEAIPS